VIGKREKCMRMILKVRTVWWCAVQLLLQASKPFAV
jgi:hypothetical protein